MDRNIIPPEDERAACEAQQEALPDGIDDATIYAIMTSRHKTTFFRVAHPVFSSMLLSAALAAVGSVVPYLLCAYILQWVRKTPFNVGMLFFPEMKPISVLILYVLPLLIILGVLLAAREDPYKASLCGVICGACVHGVNLYSYHRRFALEELSAKSGLEWSAFEGAFQREGYILTAGLYILFVILFLLVPYRLALKKYRKLLAASEAGKP